MSRRSLFFLAFLAAVVGVLLHRSLLMGEALVPADGISLFPPWRPPGAPPGVSNYLLVDVFLTHHIARIFQHSQLLQGELPLWNPFIACGVPFAGSMQTAVFSPIHAALSVFAPFRASGLEAFLKLLLAAVFMAAYLRGLGASRAAAVLSGTVFGLCSPMVAWLGFPHVGCALWLPLLFLLADKSLADGRRWALFALAYGCMLLGGHPPTTVHATLALAAYAAFLLCVRERPARDAALLAAGLAAGAVLAAAQLLPFLEYIREGSTSATSAAAARWASSLSPASLAHFFLPYAGGAPTAGFEELGRALGLGPGENFSERVAYVGVLPLFLAAAAVSIRREGTVRFHAVMAALSLSAAYGVRPWPALFRNAPFLSSVNPQRLILLACFSLAVLAGLGLDAVRRDGPRSRPAAWAVCALALAALAWAGLSLRESLAAPGVAAFLLAQLPVLLVGLALSIGLAGRRSPAAGAVLLPAACLAWAAFDLLWFGTGYNASVPRSRYYPETPAIRALAEGPRLGRVLGLGGALPPNTGSAFGLQDVRGMDFVTVRRYEELITGRAGDFYFFSGAAELPTVLPLLNVKSVAVPPRHAPPPGMTLAYRGEMDVYRAVAFTERVLPVFGHETVPNPADVLARVRSPGFDPGKTVLLEMEADAPSEGTSATAAGTAPLPAALGAPPGGGMGPPRAEMKITRYSPDEVRVRAGMPRPGWLLLLDTYFPGWEAFVNGRPAGLLRADYAFRAVALPSGQSEVVFRYAPGPFRLGLAASLVSLAALILISLRGSKNAR